jgi:ABC-type transport system involved in cytochrome c biogenesis permease subunit
MKSWIVAFIFIMGATSLPADELNFDDAARVVIQSGGRKKPLDTFAAESIQLIHGKRTLKDPQTGASIAPMDALFSMWMGTREWKDAPIVLVSDAALKEKLGLNPADRFASFASLMGNAELAAIYRSIQAKRARSEELAPLEKSAENVLGRMESLNGILSGEGMAVVPNPGDAKGAWLTLPQALEVYGPGKAEILSGAMRKAADAYLARNTAAFSTGTVELQQALQQLAPANYPPPSQVQREIFYNHLHPFRWAWILYLASFFILLLSGRKRLGAAFFTAGLGMHAWGIALRCLIAGRPPVTNMYESVIWVAFGVAAFAMVFSVIHRAKVYLLAAAPIAVLSLIVADSLPSVLNPNIGPLPPVLRDNFWLMTHVLTITLGYAAFAMAMGLAHYILGCYLFKPASIDENSHVHYLLNRVLQLGILLLGAGTILGGVWAYYSWGRFWGWDPKETWALIALLLYIFALHGRLVNWWGNFGMSVAAAVCFNGVLMAWYGVNFVLGKGLHSYGFGGGGAGIVGMIVALDLVFVGICAASRLRQIRQGPPAAA